MTPDQTYALGIAVASVSLLVPAIRHPILDAVSHPIIVILSAVAVLWFVSLGFSLTAVVLVFVLMFLLARSAVEQPRSVYLTRPEEDDARFDPLYNIDLQIANRTITPRAPRLQQVDPNETPLLTYPPSQDTLAELSGS
jgi:hypothetical protein